MRYSKFTRKSIQYEKELRKYMKFGYGKKCGHIGQNKIELNCVVCKSWLAFEFFSWLVDQMKEFDSWERKEKILK